MHFIISKPGLIIVIVLFLVGTYGIFQLFHANPIPIKINLNCKSSFLI